MTATGTSNAYNQGIVHLAPEAGGRPSCGTKRAHMVAAYTDADQWPHLCQKCKALLCKMRERDYQREQERAAELGRMTRVIATCRKASNW